MANVRNTLIKGNSAQKSRSANCRGRMRERFSQLQGQKWIEGKLLDASRPNFRRIVGLSASGRGLNIVRRSEMSLVVFRRCGDDVFLPLVSV